MDTVSILTLLWMSEETLSYPFVSILVDPCNPKRGQYWTFLLFNTLSLVHPHREITCHWIWGKPNTYCHINLEWCHCTKKRGLGPVFISLLLLQSLRKAFIVLTKVANQIPSKGLPRGLPGDYLFFFSGSIHSLGHYIFMKLCGFSMYKGYLCMLTFWTNVSRSSFGEREKPPLQWNHSHSLRYNQRN